MTSGTAPAKRSPAPDQLKAILLVLVIFGHALSGRVTEDPLKWTLYGFHMPAFLFLSGYLIGAARFTARPWGELLRHYWRRMVAAWLAVSVLFLLLFERTAFSSPKEFLESVFLTPAFHLWYIPLLVLALALSRALGGTREGRIALLAIAVGGYLLWRTPLREALPTMLSGNLDDRYFGFLIFFVLGLFARNGWLPLPGPRLAVVLIGAGGALYVVGYSVSGWFSPLGFLLLNVGVVAFVPRLLSTLSNGVPVVGGALVAIGQQSLWIYLLHPFLTEPLRRLDVTGGLGVVLGAAVTLAILAVSVAVIVAVARTPRRVPSASTG